MTEHEVAEAERLAPSLRAVGEALARAGYSERAVCAFYDTALVSDARYRAAPPSRLRRGLGAAIALLVGGEPVERAALPFLDDAAVATLVAVGIVERAGDRLVARASVVPLRGVLVCAARLDDESSAAVRSPDLSAYNVAASLDPGARSLLDVGCGAGALALVAARAGASVTGTDIDGSALRFARLGAIWNGVAPRLVEGDLYAGAQGPFDAIVFNAPLLRAPMAGALPLYLHSPRAESLAMAFLDGAMARLAPAGEILLHSQLSEAVARAIAGVPDSRSLTLRFATSPDGTPHALVSIRRGAPRYHADLAVPLGEALPHLGRELLDRLHATQAALAEGTLDAAALRPAPWLSLVQSSAHDGHAFRPRPVRFGAFVLDEEERALLDAPAASPRLEAMIARGLLTL